MTEVIDIQNQDGKIRLPVKDSLNREFRESRASGEALAKAGRLIDSIRREIGGAPWFQENWPGEVLDRAELSFDGACERWRSLYRSAFRQREVHHKIIADQTRPEADRNQSRRLRAQAESQIKLLTEAAGHLRGRLLLLPVFAAEGFCPAITFRACRCRPTCPRAAEGSGRDEFVSRPRFLAISEFGPRALIYHEGARYRVDKVNLDFKSDDISRRVTSRRPP